MSVLSDLVAANRDDAALILRNHDPTTEWDGFSFKGLDNVKICTLLSIIRTGTWDGAFDAALDSMTVVSAETESGPIVFAIEGNDLETLAYVADMDDEEFASLASQWSATAEFEGWSRDDVHDLLRQMTDLAETAVLDGKCLFLRIAL